MSLSDSNRSNIYMLECFVFEVCVLLLFLRPNHLIQTIPFADDLGLAKCKLTSTDVCIFLSALYIYIYMVIEYRCLQTNVSLA
jgi:hypothetical protein